MNDYITPIQQAIDNCGTNPPVDVWARRRALQAVQSGEIITDERAALLAMANVGCVDRQPNMNGPNELACVTHLSFEHDARYFCAPCWASHVLENQP